MDLLAIALAGVHFALPLAYYLYAKARWLPKPWNLKFDENYRPKVTIILPTYNEAKLIEARLDNLYGQDYPKNLMEIIVIDSNSNDGTPEIVERWAKQHSELTLKLIREEARRGKAHALNHALKYANGEIIVIADADAFWPSDALSKAVMILSDPSIGAVSCLKRPLGSGIAGVEGSYRRYYNVLRIAESKAYSTPIFHGELAAFKADLLKDVDGFPSDIGADDSYTATKIVLKGFRAIIPEDLWIDEKVPEENYLSWRIRRAQHLIQHFVMSLRFREVPSKFRRILLIEGYLHLVNPWLLAVAAIMLLFALLHHSIIAVATLTLGLMLLTFKPYRTWITAQLCLIVGAIRNLYTKEIVWAKQIK